jgi:hypothetical protein
VLGFDGVLRVSETGEKWEKIVVEKGARRIGGVASYRGG